MGGDQLPSPSQGGSGDASGPGDPIFEELICGTEFENCRK